MYLFVNQLVFKVDYFCNHLLNILFKKGIKTNTIKGTKTKVILNILNGKGFITLIHLPNIKNIKVIVG